MPRTPIIVKLADGKDHLIIDGEVTGCGQIVPQGLSWEEKTTKRCTTCFPDGKVESVAEANESDLVAEQQEGVSKPPKRSPAKPETEEAQPPTVPVEKAAKAK